MRMFIAQNKSRVKTDPFPDTYFNEYGGLYNWWAMDGLDNTGWRVPSDADFTTLTDYVDANYNTGEDEFGVGCHLKSERTEPDPEGTNDVGIATNIHPRWDYHEDNYGRDTLDFAGHSGGRRYTNGDFVITNGFWWTATESDTNNAWYRNMLYNFSIVGRFDDSKKIGMSARVLRDATANEQNIEHEDFIAEETIIPNEYTGHDGKEYDAVRIGEQVWITENLKETKRKVGEDLVDIPVVTDNTEWSELDSAAMCAYPKS